MKVLRQGSTYAASIKTLHRMKICPKNCFICQRNRDKKAAEKAAKARKKAG